MNELAFSSLYEELDDYIKHFRRGDFYIYKMDDVMSTVTNALTRNLTIS